MRDFPYSRGQRVGVDASIAQQDERGRTERELSQVREFGFSQVVYTADCQARYNEITEVDPTNGALSVQLPTVVVSVPTRIRIKNASDSANTITVNPWGDDTIDGTTSVSIGVGRGCLHLAANARRREWVIL